MRSDYYNFIKQESISDILSEIDFLSYTQKQKLIEHLLKSYSVLTINLALNEYKIRYIDSNRVDTKKIKGHLIYYCKQFKSI
jgi:hypothetical protein